MRDAGKRLVLGIKGVFCLFSCAVLSANETPFNINNAKELVTLGNWFQAVNILLPQELEYAGNPEFDFLLGTALRNNKQSSIAVQVLQRAIDTQPNFNAARFQLACALYEVGDYERAKFHFELLQQLEPSNPWQTSISRYLQAISIAGRAYQPYLSSYVSLGAGYDSNANAATSDSSFLGFTLATDTVEVDSSFALLAGGGFLSYPLDPYWKLTTSANISTRSNTHAHFVDANRADLSINIDRITDFGRVYSRLTGFYTQLDSQFNHRRGIFDLGTDYNLSSQIVINLNAQLQNKRFHKSLEVRDANSIGMTLGLIYRYANDFDQTAINLGAFQDDADLTTSPYSNQQYQVQLFSRHSISNRSFWQIQALAIQVDYNDDNSFFGEQREDERYMLSASYHLLEFTSPKWQLSVQLDLIDNRSNIAIYAYDKTQIGFNLKRTFD